MDTQMNVNGAVKGLDVDMLMAGQQADVTDGNFMDILGQLVGSNGESQLSQSFQMLSQQTDKDEDNKNIQVQLINMLAEYLQLSQQTDVQILQSEDPVADTQTLNAVNDVDNKLIETQSKMTNEDTVENVLNNIGVNNGTDFQSLINALQNTDNNLGSANSFNSLTNVGKNSFMQTVGMLTGSNEGLETTQTEAIPLGSALSLDAVYQLAKAGAKQTLTDDGRDISKLTVSEKLDLLKNAIENGDVKITKDTDISDVVNKLSESYNLSKSVETAKKNISEGIEEKGVDEKNVQPQGQMSFDYNVRTSEPVPQVKTNGTAEENAVFDQTLDSAVKTIENSVERYTAKLAPEGLGEIVIKMEKDSEGIILNISATSRKTAELINSQLTDLQANLSGYNAQVNPAVVTQPQQTTEFSAFSSQQQDSQFSQQNNSEGQNSHYAYQQHTAQQEDEKPQSHVMSGMGKINTYI